MDRELLIECIALLNTANFQETLSDKRNEVVNKLKEQLIIPVVVNCLSCGKNHAELCGSCVYDIAQGTAEQAIRSR